MNKLVCIPKYKAVSTKTKIHISILFKHINRVFNISITKK